MQKIKKITAVFLALLMIISVAPPAGIDLAPKANALDDSGQLTDTISYTFDEATGTLTISGEGAMPNYDWDESPFYEDDSIKAVIIEDGVTSIGESAFEYCTGLTSITIPASVTSIGYEAFHFCTSLKSVIIPDGVTTIDEDVFYGCESLESIIIPDSVTSIGRWAFEKCKSLCSVRLPDNLTYIGDCAFATCSSLRSIIIPDSVTYVGGGAFDGCDSLESITIGSGVTSIGDYAFEYCESLTSVEIPDSVTSIGIEVFSYCTRLASITVDENNSVYDSRDNCNAIIETATNTLIAGCKNTIIPDSVTSIGDYAFGCCYSLTSVTIPDSVTSIGENAFSYCESLTSITIGSGVTSIGACAFYNCDSLTSITIPDSVTSIDDWAFDDCDSLTDVYVNWTDNIPEIDDSSFKYYLNYRSHWTSATLHVPAGTKALYEAAENWNRFENIVEDMPNPAIEEAREAALAELEAALKATDNDKVIAAYNEAVEAVNAAQTVEAIEAAKTAGLEAMQALRSEIISITELNTPYVAELVDLEILVEKPVKKLLFTDRDGNTFTYTASSTRTLSVVNNDDGTQTWTIQLTVRHSDDHYDVTVKERSSSSWSDKEYVYDLKGYKRDRVLSVEIPDAENGRLKYGTHDVVVTTGNEVSRVQVAYNGTTATFSKSSTKATVVEDGENLVWTISFNFFKAAPETTYAFSSRSASGSWIEFEEPTVLEIYK